MSNENNNSKTPKTMRNVFGIMMILIYVGMGVLCFLDYFDFKWQWLRWTGGVLFVAYGFWRAYRQFAGIDRDITSRD